MLEKGPKHTKIGQKMSQKELENIRIDLNRSELQSKMGKISLINMF